MAEAVVDVLETIQIDEHDSKARAVTRRGENSLLQAIIQQRSIGQSGECVVVRLLLDPRLIQLAFGDVFDGTFVAHHLTRFVIYSTRVFGNPDDLPIAAMDSSFEVRH